jgi:3-methylcrotonyl-CoA carboxylase alpha subunit
MDEQLVRGRRGDLDFEFMNRLRGFRSNQARQLTVRLLVDGKQDDVTLPPDHKKVLDLGWNRPTQYVGDGTVLVFENGAAFRVESLAPRGTVGGHGVADGVLAAPMPGKVTSVDVSQGDKVTKGQRLLTLEAMKMEHGLTAPFDGTVAELSAQAGAQVSEGVVLVRVEPASSPA